MKLDLQVRCSLSFDPRLVPDAIDTHELSGPGIEAHEWHRGEPCEYARIVPAPFKELEEGQVLIVARGVSIELAIDELRAALAALDAVKGVL